ncbi:MAG: MerR family transcriptional regulator [Oscillospiraceae bacterium]|nr:MerR family transcriptional regulator [Oscillospiraceae bacterium]
MYYDEKNEIKNGLYSIGAMSEVTGLSVTAIRYYSEKGLIVPSYIDKSTGYRYFSSRHVWKLEIIKMYKKLGFSLDAILELQETKRLDVLEQIIDKSEQSVQKKIEEYKETLVNLNWLKEQCNVFRQAKPEDGFVIRHIPERKVLYMTAKSDSDIWDLAMLHQKKITKELQVQRTIQRCYGYVLKDDFLQQGELKIEGEYINLGSYYSCKEEDLKILPAGNYLCSRKTFAEWNQKEWIQRVLERVKMLKIEPDIMVFEEVSLYLLSLEDTIYELQIRISE